MKVEIHGLEELKRNLQDMGKRLDGPEMEKALRAGGKVFADAMKARAPILKKSVPGSNALPKGALRAGITVKKRPDTNRLEILVGPNGKTEYVARFTELGHRQVTGGRSRVLSTGKTKGPGREVGQVAAFPWLRPAYEESVGAAEAAIAESLRESMKAKV